MNNYKPYLSFNELLKVIDVLTWVEVLKTGDRVVYKGRLKDINPIEMSDYRVYKIMPCATSRETYLEIDVY